MLNLVNFCQKEIRRDLLRAKLKFCLVFFSLLDYTLPRTLFLACRLETSSTFYFLWVASKLSYPRILNGARFGFLHFHGFFRIPLRAISMADWGAILWRIYTHIFYFTNRLLEQTTSMYIYMYIH